MSGWVILLIDESLAMNAPTARDPAAPMGAVTKTKAESIATAINALLGKLTSAGDLEIAIFGYRSDKDGNVEVGSRWGGDLAGRDFAKASELAGAPLSVEKRMRKIPGPLGSMQEESIDFPIWYKPQLGDKAPQIAAFEACFQLLTNRAASDDANPPLVINISSGTSSDGNPLRAVQNIQQMKRGEVSPLVLQIHLSSSGTLPATTYPANRAYLAIGPMRDLFERASVVPHAFAAALKAAGVAVGPKARGMLYNAKMIDVSKMLALVQVYAEKKDVTATPAAPPKPVAIAPPAPIATRLPKSLETSEVAETVPPPVEAPPVFDSDTMTLAFDDEPKITPLGPISREAPALVLFVLDRSVEDPYSANLENACGRLQKQMADILATIAKKGDGAVDVGVVSYGCDAIGEPEVRSTLEGGLAGRMFARDDELMNGALRLDEFEEEVSDGVGGLIKIPRKRVILTDAEPTTAAAATPAFSTVSQMVANWCSEHPQSTLPPIVMHLTRGRLDAADAETALQQLQSITTANGAAVVVYHLVATEYPHPALVYPDQENATGDITLQTLWRLSSPVLGRDRLSATNPSIKHESRGFVVNGKFQSLWDALQLALGDH